MYKQQQICRKKSAYRQKIRKEYIDNLFRQRRLQFQRYQQQYRSSNINNNTLPSSQNNSNNHIQQINQYIPESGNKRDRQNYNSGVGYPFTSQIIIPITNNNMGVQYNREGNNHGKWSQSRRKISNYEQFQDYMENLVEFLPASAYTLVSLLNNNAHLIHQLIKYLFQVNKQDYNSPAKKLFSSRNTHQIPPKLSKFTSKFIQSSISQFFNYLHIIQSLLISIPDAPKPNNRHLLISHTSQHIFNRTIHLLQTNKIYRYQIYKGYFDYLVTLGQDIRQFNNLQIVMVSDCVKDIFGKYFCQPGQGESEEFGSNKWGYGDVYDSAILVCNNIVSLGSHSVQPSTPQQKLQHLDQYYQLQQLKQLFLSHILSNPKILHNMLLFGMNPPTDNHLEHILRFLINLTYIINNPQSLSIFITPLTLMILSILGQHKLIKKFTMINILLLRLINNIAVNDVYSAEGMWRQGVVGRIVFVYGGWVDKQIVQNSGKQRNNSQYQQAPQPHVFIQFISTITTYIILLNNYHQNQLNIIHHLTDLILSKNIHYILLQSLTQTYIASGQSQLISKILQSLLVLSNYQTNVLTNTNKQQIEIEIQVQIDNNGRVNHHLLQYKQLIQNIMNHKQDSNITQLCQSLLEIVKIEEQNREFRHKEEMDRKIQQQKYQLYCKQYQIYKHNNNHNGQQQYQNNG